MHAMQYKVKLPNDYDMGIIRTRVRQNGEKTDGFRDLLLKVYLIIDEPAKKQYSPLYIWNNSEGMNEFIFGGFYDNILRSFGWQQINIAIPLKTEVSADLGLSCWVLEKECGVKETDQLSIPDFTVPADDCLGRIIVYNPDKWKVVEFYFYENLPLNTGCYDVIYEILHISM
jgi:hypothetical protein